MYRMVNSPRTEAEIDECSPRGTGSLSEGPSSEVSEFSMSSMLGRVVRLLGVSACSRVSESRAAALALAFLLRGRLISGVAPVVSDLDL